MSNIFEPTEGQIAEWAEWVAERPPAVRVVAEKFFPWKLYRLTSTGHRVTLVSFGETKDGTIALRINVSGDYNALAFERQVFGIAPEELVECDLPGPDEVLGSADMSIEAVREWAEAPLVGGFLFGCYPGDPKDRPS